MRDIYSNAAEVLAFVGNSSRDSDHAMRLINYDAEYLTDSETDRLREDRDSCILLQSKLFPTGVWVIQETVLSESRKIYCGKNPPITCKENDTR